MHSNVKKSLATTNYKKIHLEALIIGKKSYCCFSPNLQFEASWVLTNITSGNSHSTQSAVDKGAIGAFMRHLALPDENLQEQALWGIGMLP